MKIVFYWLKVLPLTDDSNWCSNSVSSFGLYWRKLKEPDFENKWQVKEYKELK